MKKAAVVYWTGSGNTRVMADSVLKGLKEAGMEASLFNVSKITPEKALEYDALALGCPSMGAEELEANEFEPFYQKIRPHLAGKKIALFGSYGWGDGEWMRNWYQDASEAGAILCSSEGLIVNDEPDDSGKEACKELGASLGKL